MKEPNLLDVFAVFAMHAMLQSRYQIDIRDVAEMAYKMAQAMMKEAIEHGQSN